MGGEPAKDYALVRIEAISREPRRREVKRASLARSASRSRLRVERGDILSRRGKQLRRCGQIGGASIRPSCVMHCGAQRGDAHRSPRSVDSYMHARKAADKIGGHYTVDSAAQRHDA
jgi:hypothetical protein